MSEARTVLRNTKVMVAMTSISRVFGLVRDQLIAFLLGTTRLGDVWSLSFMIPNLFRRLIAEGAMSTAFVPILAELTESEKEREAAAFMRSVFSMVLLVATLVVTAMILLMPWVLPFILRYMNPGSETDPETYRQIILPTQIMFPYLWFISLAAMCQGVLNVNNRFALSAATPIVLNCAIIVCGLLLRDWHQNPIWGLCTGVLVGGFLQLAMQWLRLYQLGFRLIPRLRFWNRKTREAVRLWLPTTFSAGIVQINALISGMVAINIFEGAAIALQNSNRLIELVLGVFAAALSTSMLPVLARQRSRMDREALSQNLWSGLGLMSAVSIPAAVGLILAGPSLIKLLFVRGAFDLRSLDLTASALIFHGLALLPISWHRIAGQTFYAYKQVKVAVAVAGIAAAANIAGCFIFPGYFDPAYRHCGVALAMVVSSWLLFFVSLHQIQRRFQLRWPSTLTLELAKITGATLAFVPVWLPYAYRQFSPLSLLLRVFLSILIYIVVLRLLRASVLGQVFAKK